jgi:type IV pilus assembly protein PilW
MDTHTSSHLPHRARGFGLVETMVGLVIGLIAVLVIYQVFTVSEGFKRNTTAAGEAQTTGLFSMFLLGMELGNGGASMATAGKDLASCVDTGSIATTHRPIPVLITDGAGNANPDSFVVTYSISTTRTVTATFNAPAAPGESYQIQAPDGFHVGDLIVGIASPGAPNSLCASSKVTAVSAPGTIDIDINGILTKVANVTITHTGTAISFTGDGRPGLSTLFNMGPADRAQKIQYQVCEPGNCAKQPPVCDKGTPCVLYSTPLLDSNGVPAALPANPLASNIVNMKVEYGIDGNLDPKGLVDDWVQASAAGWDPASLLPATITNISQIKAVRIGIIVQSEQFDQTLGDYNWVLFDCADPNKANCLGRLTGSVLASTSPPGNWRFRTYETVIPLRNAIWNKS